MSMTGGKKVLSVGLCLALVAITMPLESGAVAFYQDQQPARTGSSPSSSSYPGQGAPMNHRSCKTWWRRLLFIRTR